ncbi:MAG: 50S ribosomal protein L3 [Candidatus Micrarchaeota archaeon]
MAKIHRHRRGSLAFRPRKRAARQLPRISSWANIREPCLLGFAGFKAGMTHVMMVDDSDSPSKGLEVFAPVTVLETPPVVVYGVRSYVSSPSGLQTFCDVLTSDENVLKKLKVKNKKSTDISKIESNIEKLADISALAYVDAKRTKIGNKQIERMEIGVGGKSAKEKLDYCKSILGNEITPSAVFKEGEYVDAVMVTKGKGWQGPVKRFGVALQRRKATGKVRHVGTLGPWHPARVMFTVPMAGQMGYHSRTEINRRILKIGEKPEEVIPNGGFPGYGVLANPYILLKGSVGGPRKRLIKLRKALRAHPHIKKPGIKFISKDSRQ